MPTKPSATLRYLEEHAVFTLAEFLADVDPTVAVTTRYTNLRNAVARGQARRLTRSLYASSIGRYRDRTPLSALVASKAAPDAVLAYHTALEAHGVAHSPFRTAVFLSDRRVKMFTVDGYRFQRVAHPEALRRAGAAKAHTQLTRAGDDLVETTTPERTAVDCLMRPDLAGGLEEILRSVGGYPNLDPAKVLEYVSALGSPTAAARTGWLLELSGSMWHTSRRDLEQLARLTGRGPHSLVPDRGAAAEFTAAWRLYVPAGLPYTEWLSS